MRQTVNLEIKKQMEILKLRRQALRIAIKLFEVCQAQEEIMEVNQLFQQANASSDAVIIHDTIANLNQLALTKGLPTDL